MMLPPSTTEIGQWEEALAKVVAFMRDEFKRRHPFDDDGDVSPDIVALRDAFRTFPVATDVLLIDAGEVRTAGHYANIFMGPERFTGPIWTLIAQHMSDTSTKEIKFHGVIALAGLEKYLVLLSDNFGLDDRYLTSIMNLSFSGCWTMDCSELVDFVPFDIRQHPEYFARYLSHLLLTGRAEGLIERFKKEIDYNELYGLHRDAILPLEELIKIDDRTACFVKLYGGQVPTIEERQGDVADIQLIPNVPADVRETFQRAKDAYIFGYFRYEFFTISVHYASLALEAAVKARWSAGLQSKVSISCGEDKSELHFPSHTRILNLCRTNRWHRGVLVEGRKFPFSSKALLDWLVDQKVVTRWEMKRLKIGLDMRNELSHTEHSSTDSPSPDKLKFVADLINKIFHSLCAGAAMMSTQSKPF